MIEAAVTASKIGVKPKSQRFVTVSLLLITL